MVARLSLCFVVALTSAAAFPSPTGAQTCTGLAENMGNDQFVTSPTSTADYSIYAKGPVLYGVWNEDGPTHAAGDYYAMAYAGTLLHENGHLLSLCHNGPVETSSSPGQPILFVASDNGRVYKINVVSVMNYGIPGWVDTRRPICPADRVTATPAVQLYEYSNPAFQSAMLAERGHPDDLVFVATNHGCGDETGNQVIAYYASDLTVKWVFNVTGSMSVGGARNGCEVDYETNRVFVATSQTQPGQHTLWALQTLTSGPQPGVAWSTNAGSILNRPRVGSGGLYIVRTDGTILKLDPNTGSPLWTLPSGSPIVRGICTEFRPPQPTRLYYTTEDGLLHGIVDNFPSPVPLWPPVSPGPGLKYASVPVVAPGAGKLYLARNDGRIQQITSAFGQPQVSVVAGRPETLWDPALSFSNQSLPDFDRLTITTTEGSIRRYCIPWASTIGVEPSSPIDDFALAQNAPNPFATHTRIEYRLPYEATVEIEVFAIDGRRVRTLVHEQQQGGPQTVTWDGLDDAGRSVRSGSYFYRLRAAGSGGRSFERSKGIQLVR